MNRFFLIVALFPLMLACEPVYGDLGTLLDPSQPFEGASETYMAGDSERAYMVTFSEQDASNVGRIALAEILNNAGTTLLTGSYRAPEENAIAAEFDILFEYPYMYDIPAVERLGATTTELETPIEYRGMLTGNVDEIVLELPDGPITLYRVGTLLDRIDPATTDGQLLLARLTNYAILVSLCRVIGFGGPGMTMYLNRVAPFQGLQQGRQDITFADLFSPKSTFTYVDYTDMTGFFFDGSYQSQTDISATGGMIGSIDFSMTANEGEAPIHAGNLNYENVIITEGSPFMGFYRFTMDDGSTFDVSGVDFNTIDLGPLFE